MRTLPLVIALATGVAAATADDGPPAAASAAEVFGNLGKFAGREVLIAEGEVVSASTHGALLRAGDDVFFELKSDMDAASLQFVISSCAGPIGGRDACKLPIVGELLPTPSPTTGWPILAHARIAPR